jgi:toxin ParE1/3/4
MKTKAVFRREAADRDVEGAFDHYLEQAGSNMALAFSNALEKAYMHIGRSPATGSPRYAHLLEMPGLRSWPLSRFPFLVFYFERDDHIDVWRVMQSQRDIPGWMGED